MAGTTMPPPRLRQAFEATRYRVRSPAGVLRLRIGRAAPALRRLWPAAAGAGAALVTAWNPRARQRALAANRSAERRLLRALRSRGLHYWPSLALDPAGRWPAEPGVLVFALTPAAAAALGRALGQRALVYLGPDAVPRLLWL